MPETSEPPARRVLLCGGPMDGRWIILPAREYSFRTVVPPTLPPRVVADSDRALLELDYVDYHVEPLPLALPGWGRRLYIGIPHTLYGRERDKAVIRAIFQRDVAQHVLEGE